jgi:hypothetical protein
MRLDLAEFNWADHRVTEGGAAQLIPSSDLENIDLVFVLDPAGYARESVQARCRTANPDSCWSSLSEGQKVDAAIEAFYSSRYDSSAAQIRMRRNRVQERILAASNQRCNIFKTYLQRLHANSNFFFGAASTIAGGVGSIVTGVNTARALAGVAGILSGVRSELNQDYFSNLGVGVINDGIEARRREIYKQIAEQGQSKPIEDYSVEAAIKDAIFYHGQCSIVAGLQEAGDAIKTIQDPGMEAMKNALIRAHQIQRIQQTGGADSTVYSNTVLRDPTATLFAGTTLPIVSGKGAGELSVTAAADFQHDALLRLAATVASLTGHIEASKGLPEKEDAVSKAELKKRVGVVSKNVSAALTGSTCQSAIASATTASSAAYLKMRSATDDSARAAARIEFEKTALDQDAIVLSLRKIEGVSTLALSELDGAVLALPVRAPTDPAPSLVVARFVALEDPAKAAEALGGCGK